MSECIMMVAPRLEATPHASHRTVQPKCSDCSRTDPLPLGSGRLVTARHDSTAGNPLAEMNICNTPDNLQIEMSVMSVKMADGSPPADSDYGFGYTAHRVIRDDSYIRKMDGEVYHEPTSVMFGRFSIQWRS